MLRRRRDELVRSLALPNSPWRGSSARHLPPRTPLPIGMLLGRDHAAEEILAGRTDDRLPPISLGDLEGGLTAGAYDGSIPAGRPGPVDRQASRADQITAR